MITSRSSKAKQQKVGNKKRQTPQPSRCDKKTVLLLLASTRPAQSMGLACAKDQKEKPSLLDQAIEVPKAPNSRLQGTSHLLANRCVENENEFGDILVPQPRRCDDAVLSLPAHAKQVLCIPLVPPHLELSPLWSLSGKKEGNLMRCVLPPRQWSSRHLGGATPILWCLRSITLARPLHSLFGLQMKPAKEALRCRSDVDAGRVRLRIFSRFRRIRLQAGAMGFGAENRGLSALR